ncbi:equilibrative nucleobase transporter 1 isoform X3 [Hydra vulgaris]|uniref:Equilibrative nucleobase transporter 1 isoform X3 n=1 Tax=Hydra vulgaris TaxID=6087 RepID=A0ABM4CVV2_HYDVU
MLNWSETTYSVILFISILFEILMCGGIVYGWASVLVIFKAKQFYFDLCKTSYEANRFSITEEYTMNTMRDGNTITDCSNQDDMLNLVFTTTMSIFNVFQFPAGLFIDKFGPKVARMIGGPILITGCMGLTFITRGNEEYLFPSFIAISIGGIIITLTVFQISNTVLWRRRAIVMCSLNGAFDSSAVVLLIFKLLYDVGVEFHYTLYVYSGLSSLLIAFITIFLVPSHDKLKRWSNEEELECSRSLLNDSVSKKQLISASVNNLNNERENYTDLKADDTKSKEIKADSDMKEIKADSDMKEIKANSDMKEIKADSDMKEIKAATFLQSIFTPIYIIELVSVLFIHLRLLCFIGSLQLNLERLTQNNTSEVSKFINLFGYLQFFGILVTPIIGLTFTDLRMIDKQHLAKEENYIHSLRTSVIPYCITNFLVMMLCLFDLIDSMKLQVPLYILCTTVRGFLYANHATFIGIAFPQYQFTTLLGFSYLSAGLFSILQYFFFYLTIHVFGGNPFWSNLILLFLVLLCNGFPVYVWWFCHQKEALFKKSQQQKFNVQCSSDSETSVVPATKVQSLE